MLHVLLTWQSLHSWIKYQQIQLALAKSHMLTWPIATAAPTDHTGPMLPTLLTWRSQPSSLACLSLAKLLPGLICLHPVFGDPWFTLMYSFSCTSVCLPSIKGAAMVFFVKSIYENLFHFKHWGPRSALSFPWLLGMAREQAQPTLAVMVGH